MFIILIIIWQRDFSAMHLVFWKLLSHEQAPSLGEESFHLWFYRKCFLDLDAAPSTWPSPSPSLSPSFPSPVICGFPFSEVADLGVLQCQESVRIQMLFLTKASIFFYSCVKLVSLSRVLVLEGSLALQSWRCAGDVNGSEWRRKCVSHDPPPSPAAVPSLCIIDI